MIFVVIPIFNEEKNIPNLAKELLNFPFPDEHKFIFSDDGSTDKSIQELKNYFPADKLIILGDGVNRGPGYVFNKAFEWVLTNSLNPEKDIIISIEADCTSDISILPHMLTINSLGYNLVLASVYVQGGGLDSTTFFRRLISSVANLLYRFWFNIKVQTISSFYRVYSVSLLKSVKEKHATLIDQTGFICMLEILMKCIDSGAKIIEVPMVLHSSKRQGKSKMKILKTTTQYLVFLLRTKLNGY